MICPKCGKEIKDSSKFCEFCGENLLKEEDVKPTEEKKAKTNTNSKYILITAVSIISVIAIAFLLHYFVFNDKKTKDIVLTPTESNQEDEETKTEITKEVETKTEEPNNNVETATEPTTEPELKAPSEDYYHTTWYIVFNGPGIDAPIIDTLTDDQTEIRVKLVINGTGDALADFETPIYTDMFDTSYKDGNFFVSKKIGNEEFMIQLSADELTENEFYPNVEGIIKHDDGNILKLETRIYNMGDSNPIAETSEDPSVMNTSLVGTWIEPHPNTDDEPYYVIVELTEDKRYTMYTYMYDSYEEFPDYQSWPGGYWQYLDEFNGDYYSSDKDLYYYGDETGSLYTIVENYGTVTLTLTPAEPDRFDYYYEYIKISN